MTYAIPLRDSGQGRNWHASVSPDRALLKPGTMMIVAAMYAEPVSIRLPDRTSRPFEDASAEFAVPLSVSR